MTRVFLTGNDLCIGDLLSVIDGNAMCVISDETWERVRLSRSHIDDQVAQNQTVYGTTTGFGKLSDVHIPPQEVDQLQVNLVRSHAVGVGEPFPTDTVRAMLALRANALVKGFSGIHPTTLKLLVDMLNCGVHPIVPSQGSLGASGDLAPLAHIALVLIGEGKAEYKGRVLSGGDALRAAGLQPVSPGAKEGLALINGTQAMTALGALAITEAFQLGMLADLAASLTMEALRSIITAFDEDVLRTRPHPEQVQVAGRITRWLTGSRRVTQQGDLRVQDAYSIRCVPQVHGASWQAWAYVKDKLDVEMNSVTDNPIVLGPNRIVSAGQFHGQPIALAMDFLKLAVAEWANISERRVERLVNPQLSGLSPFLANHPGSESGFMITQYVAAALVSENKVLAHPASVDSIPSSANQEDHVSMGTIAARQVRQMIRNAANVIAIEMLCASQALFLEKAEASVSPHTKACLAQLREWVPPLTQDASLSDSITLLAERLLSRRKEHWLIPFDYTGLGF